MIDETVQRAKAYNLFSHALLYPGENWVAETPLLYDILYDLDAPGDDERENAFEPISLEALQENHRQVFGLTGSLLYETELGLPHEFRQSQELADIAGFYQAFGFQTGGSVRERPDHLATELEFMYILTLKEAYAVANSMPEQAEICVDAQGKFVQDHLGRWIGPFCRSLERSTDERLGEAGLQSPYVKLARLVEFFLKSEVERLGVTAGMQPAEDKAVTPFNPDFTCAGCAVAEVNP